MRPISISIGDSETEIAMNETLSNDDTNKSNSASDDRTLPVLKRLYHQNIHLLVIFRVNYPIPDGVWDLLPYGTKIPADFEEFDRNEWTYSIENNLKVMSLALSGTTRFDSFRGKSMTTRAVLAIHGDPVSTAERELRLKHVTPIFKSRFDSDWQDIARGQGSAYLNEYLFTIMSGYKRGPDLQVGEYLAPLLLPPSKLDPEQIPSSKQVLRIAKKIMSRTLVDPKLRAFTEGEALNRL